MLAIRKTVCVHHLYSLHYLIFISTSCEDFYIFDYSNKRKAQIYEALQIAEVSLHKLFNAVTFNY